MNDFNTLQQHHSNWKEIFSSEDASSINNQSIYIAYDYALFNLINKSRKLLANKPASGTGMNGYIHHFIDRCFLEKQVSAIRRIVDRSRRSSNRSLYKLIEDIKSKNLLITRENYFRLFAVDYDTDALVKKRNSWLMSNIPEDGSTFFGSSGFSPLQSQEMHKQFDQLSGVESGCRSKDDVVSRSILNRYLGDLNNATESIKNYADRYVAHATEREIDSETGEYILGISLTGLEHAQSTVLRIVNLIGINFIDRADRSFVPSHAGDIVKNFDMAWATTEDMQVLRAYWDQLSSKINNHRNDQD